MYKRTMSTIIMMLSFISCVTLSAKPPVAFEQIDGFSDSVNTGESDVLVDNMLHARPHAGSVLAIATVPGTNIFFSSGMDGFLTRYNTEASDETWQISDIPLRNIAVHPDGNLVAVYESDGFSIHRISVWNWGEKKRLYAKRFKDSVISLSWSAKGKYLMIGNTSIEGISIFDGQTGTIQSLFKTSPGIVSLSLTGSSETNMITYGPSGRIMYTDLTTQKEKASYPSEQDLFSPIIFNNNLNIAGYKDNIVFILDATSGKTIKTFPASSPVMATQVQDTQPVWLEQNNNGEWIIKNGFNSSPTFLVPDNSIVTIARGINNQIIFGTDSGKIFAIQKSFENSPLPVSYSGDGLLRIDDIASDGYRLFILSSGTVFISSGPGKAPVFAFSGISANRLAWMNNTLVFWSTKKIDPIIQTSFDGQTHTVLYQSKESIRSLSVSGSSLAFIEGNSIAMVLNTANIDNPFVYSGAGLQDALVVSEDRILVSKSSTLRSPYPILLINTHTGETVSLPIKGDLCFGLRQSENNIKKIIGFLVKSDSVSTTELISIELNLQSVGSTVIKTEAQYADEDLVAIVLVDSETLITNLGKGSLIEIKNDTNGQSFLERGSSLPAKAVGMDQFLVSLNYDGSLTWFDKQSGRLLENNSITTSKLWKSE